MRESGRQALEALREIKLRGDPVAVLLADYRMPEMTAWNSWSRPWTCSRTPGGPC